MPRERCADEECRSTRRSLLCATGLTAVSAANSVSGYVRNRSADSDGDGIPDDRKRSAAFHRRLQGLFGPAQFDGVSLGRQDLLIDVRYVGETSVFSETKRTIVGLFRSHGIRAQWLEYPHRYDRTVVEDQYGLGVEDLLVGGGSFYGDRIEADLKNVALQLIIVPGSTAAGYEGLLYSRWMDTIDSGIDGHVNGFSLGNRAVVAERDDQFEEARLIFHELTHLALCHDDDPENTGVMGTGKEVDLLNHEWKRLREGLSNVRDGTGYDVIFRSCLWNQNLETEFDQPT